MSPNHVFSLMTENEKTCLSEISKNLSSNSIVVEVGTYLGGSASIMAHANPNITIYTYDLYDRRDDDPYFKDTLVINALGEGVPRTRDTVSTLIASYKNIILNTAKPFQPNSFNWNGTGIDLLFDDGAHTNPGLRLNLNYWLPFVKENGLVAMHDYRPWLPDTDPLRCPTVEFEINRLLNNGYKKVLQVESMFVLKKLPKNNTEILTGLNKHYTIETS